MAHAFFLGVDGSPSEEADSYEVTHTLLEKSKEASDDDGIYRLHHLRRHEDISSAIELADHLQSLVAEQPYIGRTSIIIHRGEDFGQALINALDDRGMDPVAATITRGSGTTAGETDEMGVHLGGIDVVRALTDLYRDGKLEFESHASELASRLIRDVQGFAEVLDEADGDTELFDEGTEAPSYNPGATHVTSGGLAAWLATEWSFDPSQHLKESPQTDPSSFGETGV